MENFRGRKNSHRVAQRLNTVSHGFSAQPGIQVTSGPSFFVHDETHNKNEPNSDAPDALQTDHNMVRQNMRLSTEKRKEIEKLLKADVFDNKELTDAQKRALWHLISQFQDIFVLDMDDIIPADLPPHVIDVQGAKPISSPLRRASPEQREEILRQAKIMIKNKILFHNQSAWAFPSVLVNKRDGTKRWVVDYRKLNEVTKKDVYSPGNVDDALDLLGSKQWFGLYDMCGAYHQIPLSEESKQYATVRLPSGELLSFSASVLVFVVPRQLFSVLWTMYSASLIGNACFRISMTF